ncbi:hypothetical protein AGDE_16001 [Angomonas deanei]|uniref:IPT/TIG domain/G8 domain containing protein, putative n=1 Tax=Angomonas deanei TaxID=59799 RepID=A0A7G2CDR3_9TRYP|nr:hypothetical protein AGDE_16001 [Angomonas deanei]CAD2216833.1 IPT/TIG domain/G8 domain containing protein, putative [Angomonas deanei]|eukprot:EPY17933.1 hypothetical protein AGDE_16001 [Angomonas deanei]
MNTATDGRAECCSYTYDPDLTPKIDVVTPLFGIGLSHTSIYGRGFMGTYAPSKQSAATESISDVSMYDCTLAPNADKVRLYVQFGNQLIPATVYSDTCARLIFPKNLFGTSYIFLYNAEVGLSLPYTDGGLSVNMLPAIVLPSSGGFASEVVIRLVGTTMVNLTVDINELIYINVCGKRCTITNITEDGEVECSVPQYMDVDFIHNLYPSLFVTFPVLYTGYRVHYWAPSFTDSRELYLSGQSPEWGSGRLFSANATPSSPVRSRFVYVLEAEMHSRLLLYSVTITLSPVTDAQLDFSSSTCRLQMAVPEAESHDLFSEQANPSNTTMWDDSKAYYWPPLSIGDNSIIFTTDTPVGSYILITCTGLPEGVLRLEGAQLRAYQVGLQDSGGACPVDMVSQQRDDQPITHSCPSRDGHACTMFRYDVNSTPIVLKFSPSSMLASSRNEIVTISGVNLGSSTAEIDAIVLDEAYCDVVSVEDTEIQCRMRGFITTPRSSFIRYNNATKGNAMFLVPQPFYSTTGWSSYASWMRSGLPTEEAEIEIGVNSSVLLDTSPPHLFSIKLDGVLVVSDEVDIELTLNQLIIGPTGVLVAGTPTSPHQHKFTLTLSRLERNQAQVDDVTAMQADTNEMPTDKLLHVQSGGTLMLHGLQHIYEKSTLLATANKGDTSVLVRGRMDWEIGDTILVTTPTVFASDEERAVIRSLRWVNDATVIGLVDRLNYTHEVNPFRNTSRPFDEENDIDLLDEETKKAWYQFTNVSERKTSEVILLSRSIVVQGDEISASSAVGATIWIQDSVNSRFSNVEFRRIGKRGSLKGYGVFFDTCLYSHPTSLMDGCTVHDSYNRGVVLSQTENAIISRLITFFIEGFVVAAIGTYHKSLVIQNSYLSGAWSGKGSTDTSVSIVYLSYPDIVFANNIVRLSEGHGVWYSLRHQYANSAIRTCPTTVPLNDFANNTIFACRQHGLVIYPIHQALSRTCATNVFEVEGNSGSAGEVLAGKIENSTIFMCGSYGISLPFSSGYTLSHLSVTNCNDGAVATSFATTIQQILFTVLWGSDPGGEVTTFSTTLVERTSLLTLLAEAWKGGNEEEQQTTVKHTVGLRSLHGGYINVMYCVIGNFTEGAALWLSTSTPQPSFSLAYADVVSASNQELYELHNSILSVNLQSVHFLGKNFLNASIGKRTNVHDVDGTLTHLHEDVFILPNSPFLQSTSFCRNASDVKRADGGFVVFSENVYVFSFSDFWANMVAENMSTLIHDYMLCYSADRNFITFSVHQALTAEERLKETELQKSGGESLWCSRAVVVLQHEYGKISFEVDLLPVGVAKDPTRLLASEMVDTTPASALFIFLADRNNPFTEDGVVDNARGVAATNASFHFRYLNGSSCLPTRFWYSGSGFSQSTQENVKVRVEIGSSYWLNLTGSDTGYVWYKQEEEQVPLSVMKLSEREDNSSNSSSSSSGSGSESSSDSSSSGPGEVMVTKRTTYASIDFLYYMQHSINNNLTIALTVPHLVGGSILIVKCKEGERCLDSIMPSYNAVAAFERNISEPYKDWFSSKSWLNECAPWLGEKEELDEREAFLLGLNKEQVYAIDLETRVRLNRSANVPGVLHINGELLIEGDEGSTDVIVLRAESMIVFGNLTVRSPFAHSPKIRIELGYVSTKMMGESTLPVDCTSRLPLRVSPSKRVFCGQTLFLGHVLMLGRQSPTVYRSTKVMKSGSKSLPVLEAIRNEESYNTTFAPFYDFFDVPNASALVAADTKAWTAGDTLGVTSSSGRLQEAEMVVAAEDKEQQITSANISQTTEATTLQDAFLYTHGFEEEDYTAYSEVVALSKNIEMHCLITPEQAERYPDRPLIGCSIVLIFSILLNQTSDFSAVGTSFHGFGRGGQYEVPPSPSTPPLEDQGYTWEYLLNKETFIPGILAIETTAVSILSSTFVDSYGPSVYINNTRQASNIAFVFIDSVVWNGQGGGIRVDSGYQELLLQASMGLQEKSIIEADLSQFADLIGVKNVQVYILYSLVTGTTYYRGGSRQTDPYTDILSLCSFLANGTNIRIYKSIAAGSEGEGFCVDWREASLLESNVAHGNVNGMFLFTSTLLSVEYILGGTNTSAVISESNFVLKGLTAYSNILTGLYSSSHRNITVLEGKFFENTVSASLSISSKYDSGTNIIRNTSFGCPTSCEGVSRVLSLEKTPWPADMPANFSVFMRPSVLCAAVGLVPSYKTVTLSYSRKDYLLNSQDNLYEYPTSARYGLYNITASGIGDIQCKGPTPLQSTLLAGLNGMSSSASIYEVEANNISYVSHPAVQWTAQSAVAVTAGRYTFNYADTVFYDADGSLFLRRQCNYVVARSTLAAVCSTQAENPTLMACCHVPFVQIRVRSLDDRQKGLSHIMLRYAMSYEDSTNSSAGASMGAGASTYVLPEGVNCSTAKDITTYCSDDPTRASYLQIYKSVPRSAVLLEFDPDNYPDVFEVGSEGCRDSTTASGIQLAPFTKIRLKLLDPSKTITVWDGSFSVPSDTMTNSDQNSVQLSTTPVKWYVVKEVDPVSGSSVSYLDLSLQCGTSVTVHQLAYGELLVYSEWSIAEMERQFVQWNNNFDSADSPINFNSNLTFVTTQSYPDHFDSSRSYLRVRAMRRDWYLYNVQDACREINQFISQFSAQGRFKDSGDPYDTNFTGGNIRSFHLGDYKFDIAGVYPCINPLQAYTWRSKETEVDVFFVWKGYRLTIYLVIIIVFFVLLCAYMIARRVLHKKFKRFFATKPTPASTAVLPTSAAPSVSHVRTYAVEDGSSREVKTTTAIRIPDGKPTAVEFINDAQGSAARTRAYCASWKASPKTWDTLVEHSTKSGGRRGRSALEIPGWVVPPAPLDLHPNARSGSRGTSRHTEEPEEGSESVESLIPIGVVSSNPLQSDQVEVENTESDHTNTAISSLSTPTAGASKNFSPSASPLQVTAFVSPANAPTPTPILASRYTGTTPAQRGAVTIVAPLEHNQVQRPSLFEDGARRRWINTSAAVAPGYANRGERPERPQTPMILQSPTRKRFT